MAQNALDALKKKFGDAIEDTAVGCGDQVAYVKREKLVEVATWLRDDPAMAFDLPVFCTCIDWLGQEPRFELCYQIRSLAKRHTLRLKVRLAEEDAKSPSLAGVWAGFGWLERETYDMYGIEFEGHSDLRRIYMYEEFIGHPLRKDYPKEKRQPLVRRDDLPRN